jgi:hypothetical protein
MIKESKPQGRIPHKSVLLEGVSLGHHIASKIVAPNPKAAPRISDLLVLFAVQ